MGVHDVAVEREPKRKGGAVRRVAVRFGDDHQIEVRSAAGRLLVRLISGQVSAALDASGPACAFGRAVNILRLYMPECTRDDAGD